MRYLKQKKKGMTMWKRTNQSKPKRKRINSSS